MRRGVDKEIPRVAVLEQIVDSDRFQLFIGTIIILNALVLGLTTYEWIDVDYGGTLFLFNEVFYVIFVGELLLRIASYFPRPWNFFRSGWNVFDFIVIGAVLIPQVREQSTILRLLRLARIVRLVRFLPDAGVLIRTITRATPAVASMAVLTILILFIYGIVGWSLFGEEIPEQWGNVGTAMLTLFVLLTLENFPQYLADAQQVSPFATLFFLTYVLLAAFVVVNLLIGIVLSAMDRAREEEAEEERRANANQMGDLISRLKGMHDSLNELEAELEFHRRNGREVVGVQDSSLRRKPRATRSGENRYGLRKRASRSR
jgi:voltage-gated sodium channel